MSIPFPVAILPQKPIDTDAADTYIGVDDGGALKRFNALVNKPTDISRPSYVRSAQQWLDDLGVMAGPTLNDFSNAVVEAVATGRHMFVPAGDYTFTSGVLVSTLTKPLKLTFDHRARLIAGDTLQAAILKIANAQNYSIEIEGGEWNGDVQPNEDQEAGLSWGLLDITNVTGGGVIGAYFRAGDSYLDEVSDSLMFLQGEQFTISKCRFQGCKDTAIYTSGNFAGIDTYGLRVIDTDFYQVYAAFGSKRQGHASIFSNNTVRKSRHGVTSGQALSGETIYAGGDKIIAEGNQFTDVGRPFYLENADHSSIIGNIIDGWGFEADGTMLTGTPSGINLLGSKNCLIEGNQIRYTGSANANAHGIMYQNKVLNEVTFTCTDNVAVDNILDGGDSGAGNAIWEANNSDHNTFRYTLKGTWTNEKVTVGANSVFQRHSADGLTITTTFGSQDRMIATKALGTQFFSAGSSDPVRINRIGGTAPHYLDIFQDGSGHHYRGLTPGTVAKPNLYESNADAAVSGGTLGHNFLISGVSKMQVLASSYIWDVDNLPDYADDTAAAAGGVPVDGLYRTGSAIKIRVS